MHCRKIHNAVGINKENRTKSVQEHNLKVDENDVIPANSWLNSENGNSTIKIEAELAIILFNSAVMECKAKMKSQNK